MAPHTEAIPTTSPDTAIDQRIETWIDVLVASAIGRFGFRESDRDDLKQELRLCLLERQVEFNPGRSRWHTFANRLIKARMRDLIRERTTTKRGWGVITGPGATSTEGEVEDGILADIPAQEAIDHSSSSDLHRCELAMDVSQVMASLPVDLRRIAQQLTTSDPKDAWRELGLKKSTFYDALGRLRAAFAKAGLDPSAN
ncbi:hypothetical protein LBMAG53_39180 [Planctomycetota bacterium]|nr:hypothetical protein LBMAG53_39180 [Planctomycetota bacterium]